MRILLLCVVFICSCSKPKKIETSTGESICIHERMGFCTREDSEQGLRRKWYANPQGTEVLELPDFISEKTVTCRECLDKKDHHHCERFDNKLEAEECNE